MAIESVPVSLASAAAAITLSLAAAFALSGQKGCTTGITVRAVEAGWRDAEWLERNPTFASFERRAGFRGCLAAIRSCPKIQWR
jgi:hypothetical protein